MKTIYIPSDHKLISFDVKLLITNVPLNFTIDLILKGLYEDSEIQTNIQKRKKKKKLNDYSFYVRKMYILVTMV